MAGSLINTGKRAEESFNRYSNEMRINTLWYFKPLILV
jgi:hypothetical protein